MKVKEFTVEQLRSKYKWFKREWKHIQNKIKFGSGLSSKETECTRWYDTLNPVFTEGVDEFTDVACSAGDIAEERSFTSVVSVHASSGEEEWITPLAVMKAVRKDQQHHSQSLKVTTSLRYIMAVTKERLVKMKAIRRK